MPEQLRDNVEDTVKEDGSSEATCAIIRLETLPAFDDEELRESGNPLGCFTVYMGTDPANVEYIVSSTSDFQVAHRLPCFSGHYC